MRTLLILAAALLLSVVLAQKVVTKPYAKYFIFREDCFDR